MHGMQHCATVLMQLAHTCRARCALASASRTIARCMHGAATQRSKGSLETGFVRARTRITCSTAIRSRSWRIPFDKAKKP